jgi:hypothetical protein
MPDRARPCGPASARYELAFFRVRAAVRFEVLLPHPPHFLEPRVVRASFLRRCRGGKMGVQQRPERGHAVAGIADVRCDSKVGESGFALFGDKAGVLQQPEMARNAGLRDAENAGELAHVQALRGDEPQQPQPRGVAEEPEERAGVLHIYKSTLIDSIGATADRVSPARFLLIIRWCPNRLR